MGLFYPDCGVPAGRSGGRGLSFAGVAAGHIAMLGLLAVAVPAERLAELARPIAVRLIELAPEAPPSLPPPPRPKPAAPAPVRLSPPVMAVTSPVELPAPTVFTVPPQPQPQATAPAIVAAPTPEPATASAPESAFVAARFDADYLDNPKPLYPHASRRFGEEGKVMLRVFVSADGGAKRVEVKHSSGFQRLDQAAEEAVARWRFVPARRGDQAVTAWVVVPIVFSLNSES